MIENGTFTWGESTEAPILKNINLRISSSQLVAVVGTVGSGKSSLVSAFLGEMDKVSGRVNTKVSSIIKFAINLVFIINYYLGINSICTTASLDTKYFT